MNRRKLLVWIASIAGATIATASIGYFLALVYGPESHGLVHGGEVQRRGGPTVDELAQQAFACLRERERDRRRLVERDGAAEFAVTSPWVFVEDDEVAYEIWHRLQRPIGFERVRAARADIDRVVSFVTRRDARLGVEFFPDLKYLLTVERHTESVIGDGIYHYASGSLEGPYGQTGRWSMSLDLSERQVHGSVAASDSFITIESGVKDPSLTVFAAIDQCSRRQRRYIY